MAAALHSSEISTLAGARRELLAKRSPRLLAALVLAEAALRVALGRWGWQDAAAVAALAIAYPFGEWAIHVYLLHLKPFAWRGRRVELATARAHREHHERPNRLDWVLLGTSDVVLLALVAVPVVAVTENALIALASGSALQAGAVLSAMLAGVLLVGVYEWTHFLIHTAYAPRTRLYRRIWQGHRLHHFKNEHYWHGITTTLADRAFGTAPDHTTIARSPTARTLEP